MLKKILASLFPKAEETPSENTYVIAQLNDKIMPIDRSVVYEDPLEEFLKEKYYGTVTGGGTQLAERNELAWCDVEIKLANLYHLELTCAAIIGKLEELGAPKGSVLIISSTGEKIPFGKLEGLALYIDGESLPAEVYETSDINFVVSEIYRLLNIEPNADRFWEGEIETGLYFYGRSFEEMNAAISGFVDVYPLCKGARVVQIA